MLALHQNYKTNEFHSLSYDLALSTLRNYSAWIVTMFLIIKIGKWLYNKIKSSYY